MDRSPKSVSAFTLVELSLVLVIIGLLVGGILAGKSLIRASGLRSVIAERDTFVSAMNAFQQQYHALPGDMPNGYSYWGTLGVAGCAANTTAAFSGCNGNGNGVIEFGSGEGERAWMHLSLAGVIPGSYNGGDPTAGSNGSYGIVTPASKLTPNTWDIVSNTTLYSAGDYASDGMPIGLWLVLGTTNADYYMLGTTVTNGEAWNIDTKIDDGHANTGNMIGLYGDNGADYYNISTLGPNYTADSARILFKLD